MNDEQLGALVWQILTQIKHGGPVRNPLVLGRNSRLCDYHAKDFEDMRHLGALVRELIEYLKVPAPPPPNTPPLDE